MNNIKYEVDNATKTVRIFCGSKEGTQDVLACIQFERENLDYLYSMVGSMVNLAQAQKLNSKQFLSHRNFKEIKKKYPIVYVKNSSFLKKLFH